jgi:hypothetical protein
MGDIHAEVLLSRNMKIHVREYNKRIFIDIRYHREGIPSPTKGTCWIPFNPFFFHPTRIFPMAVCLLD